ncbi:MAG: hypothetical protein KGL13_02085 [Gammaproteobacteria bacterium]|nr:hypothetical protein [Gammaproteobacteria bacterium]MDE2345235.1 hypothetical protein [Gammaproteobacteria bacterium]
MVTAAGSAEVLAAKVEVEAGDVVDGWVLAIATGDVLDRLAAAIAGTRPP